MGVRTFTEFQDNLTLELGQRTDSDVSTRVDDWINTAYITLTTKSKIPGTKQNISFPDLETDTGLEGDAQVTANGTKYVLVPSNCLYIQNVEDTTNDIRLTKISWRDYIDTSGRNTEGSRGEPAEYCRRGVNADQKKYVYLLPTPDAAYGVTIYYRKYATVMSSTVTTTEIGTEWDEVIQKLALVQSLMRLKRYEEADKENDALKEMFRDITGVYDYENLDAEDEIMTDITYLEDFKDG